MYLLILVSVLWSVSTVCRVRNAAAVKGSLATSPSAPTICPRLIWLRPVAAAACSQLKLEGRGGPCRVETARKAFNFEFCRWQAIGMAEVESMQRALLCVGLWPLNPSTLFGLNENKKMHKRFLYIYISDHDDELAHPLCMLYEYVCMRMLV